MTVGDGALDVPRVQLTNEGKTVEQVILSSSKMDGVFVDEYIVMPNHIHIMVTLRKNGTSGAPSPTNDLISRFVAALKRLSNKKVGYNMFQRSYYDHIIRDEDDYYAHIRYIADNPAEWATDEYYI